MQFRLHLRDPLLLDGAPVAPAGTKARLLVVDRNERPDGSFALRVELAAFVLPAGELPVAPLAATVGALAPGTEIPARTMGSVEAAGDRLVIHVPFPFTLSGDTPNGFYSPVPARTAGPLLPPQRGRGRPGPRRSPSPSPSPSPGAS